MQNRTDSKAMNSSITFTHRHFHTVTFKAWSYMHTLFTSPERNYFAKIVFDTNLKKFTAVFTLVILSCSQWASVRFLAFIQATSRAPKLAPPMVSSHLSTPHYYLWISNIAYYHIRNYKDAITASRHKKQDSKSCNKQ